MKIISNLILLKSLWGPLSFVYHTVLKIGYNKIIWQKNWMKKMSGFDLGSWQNWGLRTFLAVQWLRLRAEGVSSILGWGTRRAHAEWHGQKKQVKVFFLNLNLRGTGNLKKKDKFLNIKWRQLSLKTQTEY